jgi:lysophospholipase L1-like esterase
MIASRWPTALCAVTLAGSVPHIVSAQASAPADPYTSDLIGIVADPCPTHARPADRAERDAWTLRMRARDFGQLCRYAAQNAALLKSAERVRVVFMGDSITDNWIGADPALFTRGLVDRGISGQTTPQMVVRFRSDVIALKPRAVHIMAGTNDIAGNTGAATIETVRGNIMTMAELARANGIRVILASTPPAAAFPWRPAMKPAAQIVALNDWLRRYAARNAFTYVDYYTALAGQDGGMKQGYASDGVHPTPQGYAVMKPLALAAIAKSVGRPGGDAR